MFHPLVSIVVPSYNQAGFIGATLNSILRQSYENIECIVMDGGSTDGTTDILRGFDDHRLFWVSEADEGQSHAINKGMRKARGEILSYLNSDDLLTPDTVLQIVEHFNTHPAVDLVFGDCKLIDAAGEEIGMMLGEPFLLQEALVGKHSIRQPGTFWKRAVYERLGDFDTSLHYSMDTDYWLRAAVAGFTLDYMPITFAAFRLHKTSKSVSQQPGFLRDWRVMVDKVYSTRDLPAQIQQLRAESEAFVDWGWAKTYWSAKDYAQARPLLKKFLSKGKTGRRIVAATMLTDSYLHTPFTSLLAFGFRKFAGREILFGERRAI